MTILSPDEITVLTSVIDFILNHGMVSVADIKRRFNLTNEEYEMAMDLSMPFIRSRNGNRYWQNNFLTIKHKLNYLYDKYKNSSSCRVIIKEIEAILNDATSAQIQETEESEHE